jgi:cellobiose phosphorylase
MVKEYIITGRGYYKTVVSDPIIKGAEMCDIKSGYGYIEFKGTEEQLETFVDKLIEDEANFKYRDWFEKDEYNNLERIPIL